MILINIFGDNNIMKEKDSQNDCQIHIMPTAITDEDISALFNGLLNVVKKKFELDSQSSLLVMNNDNFRLKKELSEKQAECNRLKNEIINLKRQLSLYED